MLSFRTTLIVFSLLPSVLFAQGFCLPSPSPITSNERSLSADLLTREDDGETLYLRTVVHVVYNDSIQNFADEKVKEWIKQANNWLSGEVLGPAEINPVFNDRIGDANIELCLATETPDGQPTTGITHTFTDTVAFFLNIPALFIDPFDIVESVKADETGGKSPWDTSRYLNIWIAPLGQQDVSFNTGIPKPDYLPFSIPPNTGLIPGIMMDGRQLLEESTDPTLEPKLFVLAHEIGHALGLRHINGDTDENGELSCLTDDGVTDTPQMVGFGDCFSSGQQSNSCDEGPGDLPDMGVNFMGFNSCAQFFTTEQTQFMRQNLLNDPDLLQTEAECAGLPSSTSVSSAFLTSKVAVFPNPAGAYLYLKSTTPTTEPVLIEMYTPTGRLVKSMAKVLPGATNLRLEVPPNIRGLMFLRLRLSDGSQQATRVVIR